MYAGSRPVEFIAIPIPSDHPATAVPISTTLFAVHAPFSGPVQCLLGGPPRVGSGAL